MSQKHSMNLGNDLGNGNACYTNIICKPSFQLFFAGHITPSFWETDLSPLLHMFSVQYSKSHTGVGRCLYHVSKSRMSNKVCSSGKNFVWDSPNSPLPTSSFCSIYNSSQGNKVFQDLSFSRTWQTIYNWSNYLPVCPVVSWTGKDLVDSTGAGKQQILLSSAPMPTSFSCLTTWWLALKLHHWKVERYIH